MRPIRKMLILLALLLPAGCAETVDSINENPQKAGAPIFGAAVGAAAGEAIGSNAAQAGLAAAGLIAGLAAGPYLQKRDVVFFDRAIDQAAVADPGTPIHWHNPNTGTTGTMTRVSNGDATGTSCRNLRSEVNSGGQVTAENLTVCRDGKGPWYIDQSWPAG